MLKILHIVAGELNGGAARGAYCLHEGLLELGFESTILNNGANTLESAHVINVAKEKKAKLICLIKSQLDSALTLFYRKKKSLIFSTGLVGFDFLETAAYKNADIIHLHWINGGFVNLSHLAKVKKPIVWTLRDMWPMTGGCHVADFIPCENYKSGCGHCKQLGSQSAWDLSRFVFNRKKRLLPKTIKLVGISHWLTEKISQSALFKNYDVRTIYNNINVQNFSPLEKKLAREMLNISTTKKIILACAHPHHITYKGFDKFLQMLGMLDSDDYMVCFFGALEEDLASQLDMEYKNFGYLHDDIALRILYSAADVFVAPNLIESFGKTLAESMACGTPVVCFDATGCGEIVDHKINGYKASAYEVAELAEGVRWVLDPKTDYILLAENAQQKVRQNFDVRVIAKQYTDIYNSFFSAN